MDMLKNFRKVTVGVLLLLALQSTVHAGPPRGVAPGPRPIESLTEGPPKLMTTALGPNAYVKFEVEELNPDVAWVAYFNYDWHRKKGIEIPPDGLNNPEFRRRVLATYGWYSRGPDDPDHLFTGKKKVTYADRYGGFGIGTNLGSGRANVNGEVQSKGNLTPLVKSTHAYHKNGRAKSIEGVDEAIWGSLLNSEMPHGSNEIVCLIIPGGQARIEGEDPYPTSLIWREDPLRPAHYMSNQSEDAAIDAARMKEVLPRLYDHLPMPANYHPATKADQLRTGFLESVDREAQAQAAYYRRRLYFGSNSPSNVGITRERLDLGDHTAQNGYTPIVRLEFEAPFGDTKQIQFVINDFRSNLSRELPSEMAKALPSESEVTRHFTEKFKEYRAREMVVLSGMPPEIVKALESQPDALGEAIQKVAEAGNVGGRVDMIPTGWANTGKYNLAEIMIALADSKVFDQESLDALLSTMIPDIAIRYQLSKAYSRFMPLAIAQAQSMGVSSESLKIYMQSAARIQNMDLSGLQRGDARWHELWRVTDDAIRHRDFNITQDYIEKSVRNHLRTHKEAAPFQLVLEENLDAAQGIMIQSVFNAKKGEYTSVMRVDVTSGSGHFYGHKLSPEELATATLVQQGGGEARAIDRDSQIEFELPSGRSADPHAFSLRLQDGRELKPERVNPLKHYSAVAKTPCSDLLKPATETRGWKGFVKELFRF